MKTTVNILLVIITLSLGLQVKAQSGERNLKFRERIIEVKLRKISNKLNLEPAVYEKFRPIYLRYENDIMGIDFKKTGRLMRVNPDSLTNEEAEQIINSQMEGAKKLLEIREKYYDEFSRVLKPQQIIKLYQTENEIRKKVAAELKKRKLKRL
jgi:hypothetical protein